MISVSEQGGVLDIQMFGFFTFLNKLSLLGTATALSASIVQDFFQFLHTQFGVINFLALFLLDFQS
jgi:hypothetical protein